MKHTNRPTPRQHANRAHQRGVALFVVIVFVMLSMLLALWAARSSLFNEILVGNDADYQRTFEAAQAMLQDAELDIRGVKPDGTACIPIDGNIDICRPAPKDGDSSATPPIPPSPGAEVYFDIETKDLGNLLSTIAAKQPTTKCFKGICQKRADPQDFWNDSAALTNMIASDVGARYGEFTGADAATTANPLLANTNAGEGAWYWVEMMPYTDPNIALLSGMPPGANVARLAPASNKRFIYRITALARGNKPGSEVVLQSTLSIQKAE